MKSIRILVDEVEFITELNDSATANTIWDALPIDGSGSRWGEEIYFSIPVSCELADDARAEMQVGELAYWPPGSAFCIFWGPTPASETTRTINANQRHLNATFEDAGRLRWLKTATRQLRSNHE